MPLSVLWLGACIEVSREPVYTGSSTAIAPEALPAVPRQTPDEEPNQETTRWEAFTGEARGDFLYREGVIHDFDITLDAEAASALASEPTTHVPATFTWGGETWLVGLRLKGSSTFRPLDMKPSLKIDFREWEPEARFHGVNHLTLQNMVSDKTMLREHAYYWYAAQLGVPAPRHGYARIRVNGEPYGLYGIVETMDGQLVDRLWPEDDDGPLYESSGADLTEARDWFEIEEEGTAGDAGDIDDLVDLLDATSAEGLLDTLVAHFDTDALFTYWAMDLAAGNDDGYARNRHNYLLYYAPAARRWSMIPWGTDRSFEDHSPIHGDPLSDPMGVLVTRCLADGACMARLDATILAVAEGWSERGLEDYAAATIDHIQADCETDPRREKDCAPETLLDYLDSRVDEVRAQLP